MKSEAFSREHQLAPATLEEEASDAFVRRLNGDWSAEDQLALESRLQRDPSYGDAFRRVEESWGLLDELAETPVGLKYREEAVSVAHQISATRRPDTRQSAGQRWRLAASLVGVALLGITAWQLSSHGYGTNRRGLSLQVQNQYREYHTGIGEQRSVTLSDHSQIMLDVATRIRARLSGDARLVQLEAGQAEFHFVKDPARPFKVEVDGDTITDLGTVFNVNRMEGGVDIAVIEGRGRVDRGRPSPGATTVLQQTEGTIELSAGEELSVSPNGPMSLNHHADLASLSAWRDGLVII